MTVHFWPVAVEFVVCGVLGFLLGYILVVAAFGKTELVAVAGIILTYFSVAAVVIGLGGQVMWWISH